MGNKNSGRRPASTALKVLRGKLAPRPSEPQPPRASTQIDEPPQELEDDPIAIAEWVRVVPMMRKIGLVSEAERGSLIALCQQWSRYLDAQGQLRALGSVITSERGPIVNPYLAIADKSLHHCLKLWVELGLTPSARSRISALPQVKETTPSKWAGVV